MKYQVKYGLRSTDEAEVLQEAGGHTVSVNRTALCINRPKNVSKSNSLGRKTQMNTDHQTSAISPSKYSLPETCITSFFNISCNTFTSQIH